MASASKPESRGQGEDNCWSQQLIERRLEIALHPLKQTMLAILINQRAIRALILDPWKGSQDTGESKDVRDRTLTYYNLRLSNGNFKDMFGHTSDKVPMWGFKLAHIWPVLTLGEGLDLFDLPTDVDNVRNCMFLPRSVKEAFDRKRCTFNWNLLHSKLVLQVVDDSLLADFVFVDPTSQQPINEVRFRDLNGRSLALPKSIFPYRRLLDWHSKCAHKLALQRGWIPEVPSTPIGRVLVGHSETCESTELENFTQQMRRVDAQLALETEKELGGTAYVSENEVDEIKQLDDTPSPPKIKSTRRSRRRRLRKNKQVV